MNFVSRIFKALMPSWMSGLFFGSDDGQEEIAEVSIKDSGVGNGGNSANNREFFNDNMKGVFGLFSVKPDKKSFSLPEGEFLEASYNKLVNSHLGGSEDNVQVTLALEATEQDASIEKKESFNKMLKPLNVGQPTPDQYKEAFAAFNDYFSQEDLEKEDQRSRVVEDIPQIVITPPPVENALEDGKEGAQEEKIEEVGGYGVPTDAMDQLRGLMGSDQKQENPNQYSPNYDDDRTSEVKGSLPQGGSFVERFGGDKSAEQGSWTGRVSNNGNESRGGRDG
jgi:hypothetical protein